MSFGWRTACCRAVNKNHNEKMVGDQKNGQTISRLIAPQAAIEPARVKAQHVPELDCDALTRGLKSGKIFSAAYNLTLTLKVHCII